MLAAQNSTATKIYSVNHWEALPPLVLFASSPLIFRALEKNASLTLAEAQALNPQSVNSFDRPACFYDPGNFANSTKSGELVLTISVVSPLILLLDKKISRDWADLLALLLVTHGVDNALYYTSSVIFIKKKPKSLMPFSKLVSLRADTLCTMLPKIVLFPVFITSAFAVPLTTFVPSQRH